MKKRGEPLKRVLSDKSAVKVASVISAGYASSSQSKNKFTCVAQQRISERLAEMATVEDFIMPQNMDVDPN